MRAPSVPPPASGDRSGRFPSLDVALARRLEDGEARRAVTYATALADVAPDRGCGALPIGNGVAVHALGARASRAFALGMHGPVTDAEIAEMEAFYAERAREPIVSLCPFADGSLVDALGRRGYAIRRFEQIWIRPIDGSERALDTAGVRVTRVPVDEGDTWSVLVARGHAATDDAPLGDVTLDQATARTPGTACFYATIDGEPIAAAAVMVQDRIASFFGSSTLPRARRRGAHGALLAARLAHAAERGCDLAMVVTEPGTPSQRNVERFGFRLAYTKVELAGAIRE